MRDYRLSMALEQPARGLKTDVDTSDSIQFGAAF